MARQERVGHPNLVHGETPRVHDAVSRARCPAASAGAPVHGRARRRRGPAGAVPAPSGDPPEDRAPDPAADLRRRRAALRRRRRPRRRVLRGVRCRLAADRQGWSGERDRDDSVPESSAGKRACTAIRRPTCGPSPWRTPRWWSSRRTSCGTCSRRARGWRARRGTPSRSIARRSSPRARCASVQRAGDDRRKALSAPRRLSLRAIHRIVTRSPASRPIRPPAPETHATSFPAAQHPADYHSTRVVRRMLTTGCKYATAVGFAVLRKLVSTSRCAEQRTAIPIVVAVHAAASRDCAGPLAIVRRRPLAARSSSRSRSGGPRGRSAGAGGDVARRPDREAHPRGNSP